MKASHSLDTIRTSFDEEHLVANAGLLLPATLMQRLGVRELLDEHVRLGRVPGAANVGLKGSALVAALLSGAKWINDVAVLRAGETARVLGHWVAAVSITVRLSPALHKVIASIPHEAWTPIPYWFDGAADVAETTYTPFGRRGTPRRLIVRRVKPNPGSQLEFAGLHYTYHALITDREGTLLELEADHRRHAVVENTIRDLKDGVALDHLPSGRFAANGAWLAFNVMAHNLARWTSHVALGETLVTTTLVRTRYVALPGRLVHHARQLHLHLPARWPWAEPFLRTLEQLRSLPAVVSTPA